MNHFEVVTWGKQYCSTAVYCSGLSIRPRGGKMTTTCFINIDCGASENYKDKETGLFYESDTTYIDTGEPHEIVPVFSDKTYPRQQRYNLRSFPQGKRNCYTLKPNREIQNLGSCSNRELKIEVNAGSNLSEPVTLEYLVPMTINSTGLPDSQSNSHDGNDLLLCCNDL
ncbi:hypothetical protein Q3G72_022594 [Acer saccharum]|nr:hypothetical protein Q3G72_022594 [Acer saccharum]